MLSSTVAGLAELFGYEHSLVLLLDEDGRRLYTIASRGYDAEGVGSEVIVGEGLIGMAAARCTPLRVGNLRQMAKYSRTVRRSYEDSGDIGPGRDLPVPGLPDAESRLAVPAMAFGAAGRRPDGREPLRRRLHGGRRGRAVGGGRAGGQRRGG